MKAAEDFDAFIAVVDAGSISEAARVLRVPRATLSRQLARLESRLGVRLLHRTTRTLSLTEAGRSLYPRAKNVVDAATAAVDAVNRLDDVPRGVLRVSTAPLHHIQIGELVGAFIHRYPEVAVELRTSTVHVDLASEQVDVAFRGGLVRDQSLMARTLFRSELIALASPDYLARVPAPNRPEELVEHRCLRGFQEGVRPVIAWPLRGGGRVRVDGPFVSNDLMALLGAALSGLGIALLPRELVGECLESSALVTVLPGVVGLDVSLTMVWLEREFLDPKVRAFVDMAVDWASAGKMGRPDIGRM